MCCCLIFFSNNTHYMNCLKHFKTNIEKTKYSMKDNINICGQNYATMVCISFHVTFTSCISVVAGMPIQYAKPHPPQVCPDGQVCWQSPSTCCIPGGVENWFMDIEHIHML